ncbi:hypothetical protein J4409_03110 [Candidatus Woesearchaeota archaeon]|nr:hypothetical protein [Candidatus Woesearchaeota archaeon]
MAEIDYVAKDIKISVDDIVNFKQLYKLLRNWFNKFKYDFYEKEHIEDMKPEDIKNLSIKMESDKKIDDYTKFHIELRLKGEGLKPVMRNDELCTKGKIKISFEAYLENDYEGRWDRPFFLKFYRTLHDKYIRSDKYARNMSELKDELYDLMNKTKSFLKVEEFKK